MFKLHWTTWSLLVLCIGGVIVVYIFSVLNGEEIPMGVITVFSTISSGILGYAVGKSEVKK